MRLAHLGRALSGASVLAIVACSSATTREAVDDESTGSSNQAIVSTQPDWNGWGTLGGGLITDPSIVAYDNNHVAAFATSNDLYFNWFQVLGWTGWVDLGNNGNPLNAPPIAVRVGNNVEVFVEDTTTGFLLHKEGTFHGNSLPTWSAWESIWLLESTGSGVANTGKLADLGHPPAVVVTQPNNQLNIIANFADGSTKAITGPGFGGWSFWTDLGGVTNYEPGAVSWGPSRLDVFVVGLDTQIYHRATTDNGVTWNSDGWQGLGGNAASAPSVVSWGPNRVDLFVSGRPSGQTSGVQHLAWDGGSWAWDDLKMVVWQNGTNGPMSQPVAITTGVGAINVFAQGIDQGLETMAMLSTSPPKWGGYEEVSTCFRTGGTPAVVSPDNTFLDLVVTGYAANGSGALYANSTGGGSSFTAHGIAPPPVCSCGAPGGTCCWPNNGCNDGAECGAGRCACDSTHVLQTVNGQAVCTAAGDIGDPCKADGTCNPGQIACQNGNCVESGKAGEPCNPNGTCNAGAILCRRGNCLATGNTGGPCNVTGTPCNDKNAMCMQYQSGDMNCDPAGQPGEDCRPDGSCDGGYCDKSLNQFGNMKWQCVAGGTEGAPCDSDGTCNAGALVCNSAKQCVACGTSDIDCCSSGKSAAPGTSGAQCVNGLTCTAHAGGLRCETPPPPPPSCNQNGDACCPGSTCGGGLECHSGKCGDKTGCGEYNVPAASCCVVKAACRAGDPALTCRKTTDGTLRCLPPVGGGSACPAGETLHTVTLCISYSGLVNGGSTVYGPWCSDKDAKDAYDQFCAANGCKVMNTGSCPASPVTGGIDPINVGTDPINTSIAN